MTEANNFRKSAVSFTGKLITSFVAFVFAIGVAYAIYTWMHPVVATVHNDSNQVIKDVTVFGRSYSESIPSLAPGESRQVEIRLPGESDLNISFSPKGWPRQESNLGMYVEMGWGLAFDITINSELEATAKRRSN